jgi:hypothetical protein
MFPITVSLVGFLVLTLFGLAVVAVVLAGFSAMHSNKIAAGVSRPPVNPPPSVAILSPHLADDLEQLRVRERNLLTRYKWIDEKAGIARIPIGRAIEILGARVMPSEPQRNSQRANHE